MVRLSTWSLVLGSSFCGARTKDKGLTQLDPLAHDLERLDGDLVPARPQRGPFPFARPGLEEVPADDQVALRIQQQHASIQALHVAVDDSLAPVPEIAVPCHPAAHDDRPVVCETR